MTADEENLIAAEKLLEAAHLRTHGTKPSVKIGPDEAINIADQAVKPVRFQTKLQWGAIGAFCVGGGLFLGWAMIQLSVVSTAQAQTAAKQEADHITVVAQGTRIESLDSGTRVEVANLRREMADERANTAAKFTNFDSKLDRILSEVKKR